MVSDTVGDCFTRIRNGAKARQELVTMPYSKLNERILRLLKQEGFLSEVSVTESAPKKKDLVVRIKYETPQKAVLEHIRRVSKPGHRVYGKIPGTKGIRDGLGFRIISTSKGILSDRQAIEQKVGGEIIGEVW
ncbi:MAG: ribosomal protein [Bacteriovoracaceae bacterium]|nr:ribosomal protein [Bacteriovoracaceae bacterium]